MKNGRLLAFTIAAVVVVGGAWWSSRLVLVTRLTIGAERDLETIVDLAAVSLSGIAREDGSTGRARLEVGPDEFSELRRTLERASDRQLRTIYLFDDAAHVLRFGANANGLDVVLGAPPAIVGHALDRRRAGDGEDGLHGTLFAPYPGLGGDPAVGAWRFLPALSVGVVAERPYDRFIRPVRWLDGAFFIVLGVVLLGALYLREAGIGSVRALFGRKAEDRCGPYVLERLIGTGAMSDVYLAHHRHLGRRVAVKRLKPLAHRDELAARFTREAKLASHLAHPNIVAIHDYGALDGGGFWYAMEYIEGETLAAIVASHGPLAPLRAVRLLRQVASAIGHMHRNGLLHRDVKPDNVMVSAAQGEDFVKLIDFGLVKDLAIGASRDLTRDIRVLGTPAFMAPERLADPRRVDARSDIYGIGCIGFMLLTGRKPFEAANATDLAQQVLHVDAPRCSSLSPVAIPLLLDNLIASCMAKDIDARPPSADALVERLDAIALQLAGQEQEAARPVRPDAESR